MTDEIVNAISFPEGKVNPARIYGQPIIPDSLDSMPVVRREEV